MHKSIITESLEKSLTNEYTKLLSNERILGELRDPPISMAKFDDFFSSQMTVEVDQGRYLHFLFFVDGLNEYEKDGFVGVNPIEPISKFVERSINSVTNDFSSRTGFREGLSLVIACGWGRSIGCRLPPDSNSWRIDFLPAHDLQTIGNHTEFKLLDIFRIFDARDKTEEMGITVFNLNGVLNLYGWMNSNDGHLIPHEQIESDFLGEHASFLNIPQNSLLRIRLEVAEAIDKHVVRRPDGSAALVRRLNGTPRYGAKSLSPFYVDIEALDARIIRCVYEGDRRNFWIECHFKEELSPELQYQLSNMANNWGEAIFRHLNNNCIDRGSHTFSSVFEFQEQSFPKVNDAIPDDDDVGSLINASTDIANSRVNFDIANGFLAASRRSDNLAERTLVIALLSACLNCLSNTASNDRIDGIVDEIIGDVGARHFHSFLASDIRDYVRDSLPTHGQFIRQMDDANSRIGLGWLARERADGGDLNGRDNCCAYINALVRKVAERLKATIAKFDRISIIEKLLVNHEACSNEAKVWDRTFRAVRSLSEDADLAMASASEKISLLNAASLASRLVIEIALCEAPLQGGAPIGRYDIGQLLADASQIFHLGGYSDAMNAEAMPATIRISPGGDVLMNHGFTDNVVEPFGRNFQIASLNAASNRYIENYQNPEEKEADIADHETSSPIDLEFKKAWLNEFGVTTIDISDFLDGFHALAMQRGEAVLLMPESEMITFLDSNTKLERQTIVRCVAMFTLKHRPKWDKSPEGFSATAWLPWRFRRRLSLVSRPIVQIEECTNPRFLIAPAMIVHHVAKFVSDVRFGRFDEKEFQKNGPASQWIGRVNHTQGEAFNQRVADAFSALGWSAKANLTDGQILQRAVDQRFGDVDVLAWSKKFERVLVIECKDLSFDKTLSEISRRLARYRGITNINGKKDDLRKHLDRCSTLNRELEKLSSFVGFEIASIESLLVFGQPAPMQFDETLAEHKTSMLTIQEIPKWIDSGSIVRWEN